MKQSWLILLVIPLFFKGLWAPADIPIKQGQHPIPPRQIDLNVASTALLQTLPEVGPRRAEQIINARPFKTNHEVTEIKGISERHLKLWEAHLTSEPSSQVTSQ